ncbi:type VII secretion protein EssC [Aristaeella hokkaidonensis]|uniref:Type VII secretion protein EssC n=2 Tax=Aristaeella hokkaidonensis TaxID=3046382 RepID=A0AC61MVK8_9FIRM|nr:type VII secretion protein EssC [Aristaeella hokkaidonensis]QUC66382.1 type VII secretion protein EssC [Aristaeella hokkaidonensis]SNT94206.1 DNA segregation ATPase FtsK/SpoIIIE, S-DNA-T family [Aristaeella hokkaidonensis]
MADGLSITELPHDTEGQITIYHTSSEEKKIRLLDVEGNSIEWRLFSTPEGSIYLDGKQYDDIVLKDGLTLVIKSDKSNYVLLCQNNAPNCRTKEVTFYYVPQTGIFRIGNSNCDITCQNQRWIGSIQAEIVLSAKQSRIRGSSDGVGVYLNYRQITDSPIQYGDIVDLYGLRLVYLKGIIGVYTYAVEAMVSPSLLNYTVALENGDEKPYNKHLIPDSDILYYRSPRAAHDDYGETISIDAPPPKVQKEEMPLIFSVGSSAFMSVSSIMMAMNTISSAQVTGAKISTVLPSVLMAAGMFAGSLLMPVLTRKYNNKQAEIKEKNRHEKYIAYLNRIDERIKKAGEEQKARLIKNYLTPDELVNSITKKKDILWSRMPFHNDFLTIRLGTARLNSSVNVSFPKHNFTLEEDDMQDAVSALEKKDYSIKDTPLLFSLRDAGILGVIAEHDESLQWIKGTLMQLCSYHSYKELKLVLIYDKSEERDWEFARWFPHIWSDNREFRAIGTDKESMRNISAYLEAISLDEVDDKQIGQMCVVVLANARLGEQCYALTSKMKNIGNSNVRVIALANNANELPKECESVIVLEGKLGTLNKGIRNLGDPVLFSCDSIPSEKARQFAVDLFNTHLSDDESDGQLVDLLTMFDMLRCGNVEQINAGERWRNSNPVKTLAAPIGIDKYGSLLNLDIHQNYHGPHGLIAGMTGSGKSEFIITYILSMAINYSPLEVGFILIDYKGGGMSDTLAKLPHVVGVIDNLGGSQGIHRSLVSIKSEIIRRQIVFKEISEKKHISNMDIYKYQAMYRNGEIEEPMQHLVLVSDEFAELKEQESGFMEDIVSMARIGRSLGIHLILATQKPTGVVNPQIASNARFHVCLKVQDRSDSMEILGRPEAALLTKTGRFYLQVGFNEVFEMGQSAWSGAVLNPKPHYVEEPDTSFELLNDIGQTIVSGNPPSSEAISKKSKQVDAIVDYLKETAIKSNLMPRKSWKAPLPEIVLLDTIDDQNDIEYIRFRLDPVVGLVDDPRNQNQYPLQLNFHDDGNAIIYGFAGAGKHELIDAAVYSLCKHHTADEVNIYCLDFATESSRKFAYMPQVGDVIVSGEDEKLHNFVRMLSDEMDSRRKKIATFGGNIDLYREETDTPLPSVLVVIENTSGLLETYPDIEDELYRLVREGTRFGIWFLITSISSTALRYRFVQNFKQVLCLQLTDRMEYSNILGKTDGVEPMNRLGSGICKNADVLEFQTGFIYDQNVSDGYQRIQKLGKDMAEEWTGYTAEKVRILPEHVSLEDVCSRPEVITMDKVPTGIEKEGMLPAFTDLTKTYLYPILYNALPEIPYLQMLAEALASNTARTVYFFDAAKTVQHSHSSKYILCDNIQNIMKAIDDLYEASVIRHNEIKEKQSKGENAEYSELVLVVVDAKQTYDLLKDEEAATAKLDAVMKMGRTDMCMYVILAQDVKRLSTLSMRMWYERLPDRDGIWLGDGIQMQSALRNDVKYGPDIGEQFGYIVRHGKSKMIKLIEER